MTFQAAAATTTAHGDTSTGGTDTVTTTNSDGLFQTLDLYIGDAIVRTWWFEPALSTLCFIVFVSWYWKHERRHGASRDVNVFATWDWTTGPIVQSAVAYWMGIYLWVCVVPPAAPFIPDGIPNNIMSTLYLVTEVASGIVLYDAIFFFIHWAMHEVPCLRRWHARHHEQQHGIANAAPVECRDTLRHSFMDGSLQVLVNILVQRHAVWGVVKTRLARATHNILVIWMLTESHSAAPQPYIWRRWCRGVRQHYEHHHCSIVVATRHSGLNRRSTVPLLVGRSTRDKIMRYQQFFSYLDDVRIAMLRRRQQRPRP
jgi:hypothetical protein